MIIYSDILFGVKKHLKSINCILVESMVLDKELEAINPFETKDSYFDFHLPNLKPFYKHLITIVENDLSELKVFWVRVSGTIIHGLEVESKEFSKEEVKYLNQKINTIIQVKNYCPACNNNISKGDKSCSNCGLEFVED